MPKRPIIKKPKKRSKPGDLRLGYILRGGEILPSKKATKPKTKKK